MTVRIKLQIFERQKLIDSIVIKQQNMQQGIEDLEYYLIVKGWSKNEYI